MNQRSTDDLTIGEHAIGALSNSHHQTFFYENSITQALAPGFLIVDKIQYQDLRKTAAELRAGLSRDGASL